MRLLIYFYITFFSALTYSASCTNYDYSVSFKLISNGGAYTYLNFSSTAATTQYSQIFGDANNVLAAYDIICTGHSSNRLTGCTRLSTQGQTAPTYLYSSTIYIQSSSMCFEEAEEARDCDSKGANGGIFLYESKSPQLCVNGCIANNMGGSQPIFGHETYDSTTSVFSYSGTPCPSPIEGVPNVDLLSETDDIETGAGESCYVMGTLKLCMTPDIDGDGSPDIPPPETGELGDGCMSVTNLENNNSSLVCGDPDGGTDATDPNTRCGFVGSVYQCVPTDECTFVNGSAVCLDSDGVYVGTDSPDNPLNGGNLDGNNTNDIVSSDTNISSPLLSQDKLIGSQHDANLLTDNLAPYLSNINDAVSLNGQKIDNSNVLLTSIASGITDLNNKDFGGGTGIDEGNTPSASGYQMQVEQDTLFTDLDTTLTDGTGDGSKGDELATNADSFQTLLGITLDSGCVDVSYPIYNDHTFTIKCSWANYTSAILTWVFWFFTVYSVMMIALNTTSKV